MSSVIFVTHETGNPRWRKWAQQMGRSYFYLIDPRSHSLGKIFASLPGVDVIFSESFPSSNCSIVLYDHKGSYGDRKAYLVK